MIDEEILVIPATVLERIGNPRGFERRWEAYLPDLLTSDALSFQPRRLMESDPCYKQLIPYMILEWLDSDGRLLLYQYTRGSGQGEKRLHAKRSIGIGGHISRVDAAEADPYRAGMLRELQEELALGSPFSEQCAGLIYDDSNEVGRVHLGIVHRLRLEQPLVEPNEQDLVDAGFRPVDELLEQIASCETWTQLCLKALYTP